MVPRTMCSTVSATLATAFGIRGVSYSISAACATSAHCIGAAADLIRHGVQDIVFAGGGEELHWGMTSHVRRDGRAVDPPQRHAGARLASVRRRPRRLRHRRRRRHAGAGGLRTRPAPAARASTPNSSATASPPTAPTWSRRAARARCAACSMALAGIDGQGGGVGPIDYLNTHGTSTPLGDIVELEAVRAAFGDAVPPLSSTKALTGHSLGAASVHEAIYSLLMLRDGFMAGSANIDDAGSARRRLPDPARIARCAAAHGDVQQLRLRRHQRDAGVPRDVTSRFWTWAQHSRCALRLRRRRQHHSRLAHAIAVRVMRSAGRRSALAAANARIAVGRARRYPVGGKPRLMECRSSDTRSGRMPAAAIESSKSHALRLHAPAQLRYLVWCE